MTSLIKYINLKSEVKAEFRAKNKIIFDKKAKIATPTTAVDSVFFPEENNKTHEHRFIENSLKSKKLVPTMTALLVK